MIAKVTDNWRKSIDDRKMVGAIFLDLKKAFDCVDHDVLIRKLSYYGINGLELNWFISYLTDRLQKIRLESSCSRWAEVVNGVPQGSILGPLLFSLYGNDLPSVIKHSNCHLYADDTIIYVEGVLIEDIERRMQEDLNEISKWMKTNRIMLNMRKTVSMLIHSQQKSVKDRSLCLILDDMKISN